MPERRRGRGASEPAALSAPAAGSAPAADAATGAAPAASIDGAGSAPFPQLTPAPVAPPISPSGGVSASQAVGGTTTLPTTVITTGTAAWDASDERARSFRERDPRNLRRDVARDDGRTDHPNTWAQQSGNTSAEIPLTVDGDYGPATQQAAGTFRPG